MEEITNPPIDQEIIAECQQAALEADTRKQRVQQDQRTQAALKKAHDAKLQYQAALEEKAKLEEILGFRDALASEQRSYRIEPMKPKGMHEAVAVIQWSDWHIEELVDPAVVDGANAYTVEICEERAHQVFQRGLALIEHERSWTQVPALVIQLGGDFISGHIHEELMENNPLSPFEAADKVEELIRNGIDFYLEHGNFEKIIIMCNYGNHGRTTKRIRHATMYKHSHEYNLYVHLMRHYDHLDNVDFIVSKAEHKHIILYGQTCRFHHGYAINYYGGVNGIAVPARSRINRWNEGRRADVDFFGHHHTYQPHWGLYVCNGCLSGTTPFSYVKYGTVEPMQAITFIDKYRGVLFSRPIFCKKAYDEK